MSNPIDLNLISNTLDLAFVVYVTEEFHHEEGFPDMEKVKRLVEAISSQIPEGMVSAEDIINHLFEKYNIGDAA